MKQNWFSRVVCLLLMLTTLGTALASCSGKSSGSKTTTPGGSQDGETLDPNSEEALLMPEVKQYNKEFRVLATTNWYNHYQYWYDYDGQGDPVGTVDKAVYARQELLYEKYGIDVKAVASDNVIAMLTNAATAGTYVCDVVTMKGTDSMATALKGYLYDLNKFDQLNLQASYYNQTIQSDYSIQGRLFQIDGDFARVDDLRTQCVAFNKKVYDDQGYSETYGSPYDLVTDMKWTFDTMYNMYNDLGGDLNNDGKFTDADQYGVIGDSSIPYIFLLGGGFRVFEDVDGELRLTLADASTKERVLNALAILGSAQSDESDFLSHDMENWTTGDRATVAAAMFANNQSLFLCGGFGMMLRLLNEEFEFGLLPVPALYEGQTRYYSACLADWHEPLSIAVNGRTNDDLADAAEMLEIFSYHSRYYHGGDDSVYGAFFENLAELRLCQTATDREMVQLIFDSKVYDLDCALNLLGAKGIVTYECYRRRYNTFASELDSALAKVPSLMNKYLKQFNKVCPN